MLEFISDDEGTVIVDFVGRFERLAQDFRHICERARLPNISLPHLNKSTSGDYRRHYSNDTRDIVAGWAEADIEAFDYDF